MTAEPLPCPPWCLSDHSHESGLLPRLHYGGTDAVRLSGKPGARAVFIFTAQSDDETSPHLIVRGSTRDPASDPSVKIALKDAGDAARLIEMLADADPARCRELAAAIRHTAAVLDGGER